MIRHVTGDIYQIGECVSGPESHEAVRVYVISNAEQPILIDCGSHLHRDAVMTDLDELLGDTPPAYVFLTHSELPHAGNLGRIAAKWPDIQVIVSNILLKYIEIAPVLPLDQIHAVLPGHRINFAGRTLEFVNALLKDQPGSQWIFDVQTGTLFTGDAFGYFHPPEACEIFGDERPDGVPAADFVPYHDQTFRFFRWVVPEKINSALDAMAARYPIKILAPTHGNAIRTAIPEHFKRLKTAIAAICAAQGKA